MGMELIVAAVGAVAVLVGVYTLATPSPANRISMRLGQLDRRSGAQPEDELDKPFFERVGLPTLMSARNSAARILPASVISNFERKLRVAGEPMSLQAYLTFQAGALVLAAIIVIGGLSMGFAGMQAIMVLLVGAAAAAFPKVWLQSAVDGRSKKMLKALPDAVDLIVTMVEAGMSVDAALWKVATETTGPLADELRFTVRETTLGRSRREALTGLAGRTDVPELKTFVQAVVHAQETGVPLGKVLRTQANEIRLKKRQRAEAAAKKAPVKVLLLMLFFVMPALMLVLLGPSMKSLMDSI